MKIDKRDSLSILDMQQLEKFFRTYHKATGLNVALYDNDCDEVLCVRDDNCVCSLVKDKTACKSKLSYTVQRALELKKPYIYETACGLIMCAEAFFINGEHVGTITTGPVILWDKDDFSQDDFLKRCKDEGITIAEGINEIDVKQVDCDAMTGLADMLMVMVEYMAEKERVYMLERQERKKILDTLKEEFIDIENRSKEDKYKKYPAELEKELIAYVHLGDKENARKIINNLLVEIFMFADGDLSVIKAKLYELMAFFSRTAVEAGAKIKELSDIVKKSSRLLLDNIEYQDICNVTIEMLDEYLEVVYKTRGNKTAHSHLSSAVAYINERYFDSQLSLKEVATNVFLSPYYVSHLFREEMNTTFIAYLTKTRVDKAKALLLGGEASEIVAEKVGFKDASYFIKVFKKYVGVTPAKFRKL